MELVELSLTGSSLGVLLTGLWVSLVYACSFGTNRLGSNPGIPTIEHYNVNNLFLRDKIASLSNKLTELRRAFSLENHHSFNFSFLRFDFVNAYPLLFYM